MRRLWKNRRANAAVEFALALPILVLAVAGVVEFGLMLFTNSVLDSALLDAARYGITGAGTGTTARQARIAEIVSERTLGLIRAEDLSLETTVYPNFSAVGAPEPFTDQNGNGVYDAGEPFVDVNGNGTFDADQGSPGAGSASEVVLYRAEVPWRFHVPLVSALFGAVTLRAAVVVRNEPFEGT